MSRVLVYKTMNKKTAWPKEWAEYDEFREHWQEFKQILGKDLPGKFLCVRVNMNLVLCVIAVKNNHDIFNFNKALENIKEDYPSREIINLDEYYSGGGV